MADPFTVSADLMCDTNEKQRYQLEQSGGSNSLTQLLRHSSCTDASKKPCRKLFQNNTIVGNGPEGELRYVCFCVPI
jgi:hypothetical protein